LVVVVVVLAWYDTLILVFCCCVRPRILHSFPTRRSSDLPVPAGGKLELRTGGLHLMLMDLKRKPAVGDTVTFTLRFATSEPITVRAPVKPATHRNDHSHRNAH